MTGPPSQTELISLIFEVRALNFCMGPPNMYVDSGFKFGWDRRKSHFDRFFTEVIFTRTKIGEISMLFVGLWKGPGWLK